jgi:hypothetical protein
MKEALCYTSGGTVTIICCKDATSIYTYVCILVQAYLNSSLASSNNGYSLSPVDSRLVQACAV